MTEHLTSKHKEYCALSTHVLRDEAATYKYADPASKQSEEKQQHTVHFEREEESGNTETSLLPVHLTSSDIPPVGINTTTSDPLKSREIASRLYWKKADYHIVDSGILCIQTYCSTPDIVKTIFSEQHRSLPSIYPHRLEAFTMQGIMVK